jgi:hypothetical protein
MVTRVETVVNADATLRVLAGPGGEIAVDRPATFAHESGRPGRRVPWMTAPPTLPVLDEQIDRANDSDSTPVLFIHGLWLLASSWDR